MTEGAQQALRRTMEIYSNTTRFALACNYSEKVIEAIQSRCAILRYARLTDAQVLARIIQICDKENVSSNCYKFLNQTMYIHSASKVMLHLNILKITNRKEKCLR